MLLFEKKNYGSKVFFQPVCVLTLKIHSFISFVRSAKFSSFWQILHVSYCGWVVSGCAVNFNAYQITYTRVHLIS